MRQAQKQMGTWLQLGILQTCAMQLSTDLLSPENPSSTECHLCCCMAGDSDDGIVTRSVMYLFEQIQKRPKNAAAVSVR